jgi:GrpB-like predicted nucleotidyltransferase (UPF0157 family)
MKPIVPYSRKRVQFQEYDNRAPEVARIVSDIIRSAIPDVIVEHVGSTAIPGCAGRGVIDLMVLYNAFLLEPILVGLDNLGFQWVQRTPTLADDWPKGMGGIYFQGDLFRIHIHVQNSNDATVSEKRVFRDKLCRDSDLRTAYMAHKQAILASCIDDPISYTTAKSGFVQQVIEKLDL